MRFANTINTLEIISGAAPGTGSELGWMVDGSRPARGRTQGRWPMGAGLLRIVLSAGVVLTLAGCGGGSVDPDAFPQPVVGVGGGGDVVDDPPVEDVNLPPAAAFSVSRGAGTGLSATFNGALSTDSDGLITDYRWTFGDGRTGVGQIISHLYPAPGAYLVTLTVTDEDGASDTASVTVTVGQTLDENLPPGAAFTATPRNGLAPLPVVLDGTLSSDSDGLITEHRWDFGDGVVGSGPLANHTFVEPGVYQVQLVVVDDDGAQGVATQSVVVSGDPDDVGEGVVALSMRAADTAGAVGADGRAAHELDLQAGQVVELTYPAEEVASSDLDLYLFEVSDAQRPVYAGSSIGHGDREAVAAPIAGRYVLLVEAVGPGTSYDLRIADTGTASPQLLKNDFVAGELLLQRHAGDQRPLPEDITLLEADGERLRVRLALPAPADPYWTDQPFAAHYQTLRRFKQLGLDPNVRTVELRRQ
jgi:chitodextrinase